MKQITPYSVMMCVAGILLTAISIGTGHLSWLAGAISGAGFVMARVDCG